MDDPEPDPVLAERLLDLADTAQRMGRSVLLSFFEGQLSQALETHDQFARLVEASVSARLPVRGSGTETAGAAFLRGLLEGGRTGFIARSVYIVAWTAFESLLDSCVRPMLLAEPDRLIPGLENHAKGALRMALKEGWQMAEIVDYLVAREVRAIPTDVRALDKLPAYFLNRFDVRIDRAALEPIRVVGKRRNDAAHERFYRAPERDVVRSELEAFREAAKAIAEACAHRHNLPKM